MNAAPPTGIQKLYNRALEGTTGRVALPPLNYAPGRSLTVGAGIKSGHPVGYAPAITISEDLSVLEKVEERQLTALRERKPDNEAQSSAASSYVDPSHIVAQSGNHALQDYQMQLMLLEQQNKKRLMMARQEQHEDSESRNKTLMAAVPDPNPPAPDQESTPEDDSRSEPWLEIGRGGVEETTPVLSKAPSPNMRISSPGPVSIPVSMDSHQPISMTQPKMYQGLLDSKTQTRSISEIGGLVDNLDSTELQAFIDRLQRRAKTMGGKPSDQPAFRYQVLYRVLRPARISRDGEKALPKTSAPFFDPPEWVKGQGSSGMYRSNIPVENFDLYLEKNKDISFIVYQTYVEPDPEVVASVKSKKHDPSVNPSIDESIRPVKHPLRDILISLLRAHVVFADVLQRFLETSEIAAPYLFFYHHKNELEALKNRTNPLLGEQINLLAAYITQSRGEMYRTADSLLSQGLISHRYVDFLYKPGDLVVYQRKSSHRGFVVSGWPRRALIETITRREAEQIREHGSRTAYGGASQSRRFAHDKVILHQWTLPVWHWDYDGNFARRADSLRFTIIQELERDQNGLQNNLAPSDAGGEMAINMLEVVPIRFVQHTILQKLRDRGRTFWKCRKRRCVSYQEDDGDNVAEADQDRYVVDLKTYKSLHKNTAYAGTAYESLPDEIGPEAMERDECPDSTFELLLPEKIKGYNLRRKKWFDLVVDRISDVKWNKEAFSKVVMERKAKDLIQALISNQVAAEKGTDLISGKGNGLILLLHGSPGTGKTLTAESVAEIAEKPLYRVTCGDVGTKAEDVEKYLESVFHLGKLWGCVVLLDEADVFLEQRSLDDLARNALVSVFLRVLEYYEGILILTSNRVGTFDEAFKSRIQLALHYPALGPFQRLRIWENFIDRLETFDDGAVDINDLKDHLEDLSKEKMNGRQIRNALTTARQYSAWKGTIMTYPHLKDVIDVSGRFDQYLDKLHGGFTQDQLAEDEGLRLA